MTERPSGKRILGEPLAREDTDLEEGTVLQLDYTKLAKVAETGADVLPVVVQDADTLEVLILAYANEAALRYTINTGHATFWSTSRNRLWVKGESSGDTLEVVDIRVNCEQNSLLYLVRPEGEGACHTTDCHGRARATCYYRSLREGQLEPTT